MKVMVLLSLAASYKINEQLSIFGRLENILDERYEEPFEFFSSGFGAFAGFRVEFGSGLFAK